MLSFLQKLMYMQAIILIGVTGKADQTVMTHGLFEELKDNVNKLYERALK